MSIGRDGSNLDNIIVKPVYLRAVNAIVQPEVQIPCSAYFFHNWLPRLGTLRWCLVLTLRSVCTQRQPDGTNRGEICRSDLAALIGIHEATVSRILNSVPSTINPGWRVLQPLKEDDAESLHLSRFIPRLRYKYERDPEAGVTRRVGYVIDVVMDDPLIPEDEERLAVTLAEQLLHSTASPNKELTDISSWEEDTTASQPDSLPRRPGSARTRPSSSKTQTATSRSTVKAQFTPNSLDLPKQVAPSGSRLNREKAPAHPVSQQAASVSTLTSNFNYKGFEIPLNLRRKRDIHAALKPLAEHAATSLHDEHSLGLFYSTLTQLYPHHLSLFVDALEKARKQGRQRKSVNMGAAFVRAIREAAAEEDVRLELGVKEEPVQTDAECVEEDIVPSQSQRVPRHRGKASTSASAYVLGSRVNKKQLWTSLLEELRTKTTKATYDMWLRNCSISSIDDDTVVIAAPSAFAREWVNERLLSIIRHAVKQLLGQDMNVRCEALTVGAGEPENGM